MTIDVLFGNNFIVAEWQKKSFDNEIKAIEWIRKNHSKIWTINDYQTFGLNISHFEIMDAIKRN